MSISVLKSPAHIAARERAKSIAVETTTPDLARSLMDHANSIEKDGRAFAPEIMREAARRLLALSK